MRQADDGGGATKTYGHVESGGGYAASVPYPQEGADLLETAKIYGSMVATIFTLGAGAPLLATVIPEVKKIIAVADPPPPPNSPFPSQVSQELFTPVSLPPTLQTPPALQLSLWDRFAAWLRSVLG